MRHARGLAVSAIGSLVFAISCAEKLPFGPGTFGATLRIVATRDTIVVGDSNVVQARTTDAEGRVVGALTYAWTSTDTNFVSLVPAATTNSDAVAGRSQTLVAKRPGRSILTLTLPDTRFVTTPNTRTATAVVAGVRVSTSHDTTLTAINEAGSAIAASLVHANGANVSRASQGIRWTHLGDRVTVTGTGDTIRYVARTNGADTLIATHDFCLAGQKCADTVIVRVAQQLKLGLSARTFLSWTFADSLAPSVVLSDRGGTGQIGTSIRFVPQTAQDSVIVKSAGLFGVNNPVTGAMATPKLVTGGNGLARVAVLGIASDGITVLATDSLTVTVRQVARRIAVEPQRADLTVVDSIPVRALARDARGAIIADATVDLSASAIALNGVWAGPTLTPNVQGTIVPSLSGVALPDANPLAPQIPYGLDPSIITLVPVDTIKAAAHQKSITVRLIDSLAQPSAGRWVRFRASGGNTPDSVQSAADGFASVLWQLPTLAGTYTLTGVRGTPTTMATLNDSAGRIVIRHTVELVADDPSPLTTTASISATTIAMTTTATVTVTVKDIFGNVVKKALPTDITIVATGIGGGGTLSATTCTLGVCTATYTAPNLAGLASLAIQINAAHVLNSPIALTIN